MNKVIPLPNCATSTEEWGLFMKTLSALRFEFVGRKTDAREKAVQLLNKYQGQANVCAGPARHFAQLAVFELVELLEEFKYANLNNKDGPTGETATKQTSDASALSFLYQNHQKPLDRRLDDDHMRAAAKIREIYEATGAPLAAKIGSYGRGSPGKHDPFSERLALDRHFVYMPWCRWVKTNPALNMDAIISVVVDDCGLDEARRFYHMRQERLERMLAVGLYDFAVRLKYEKKRLRIVGEYGSQSDNM